MAHQCHPTHSTWPTNAIKQGNTAPPVAAKNKSDTTHTNKKKKAAQGIIKGLF
jgi:hypothetical protein